VIAGALALAALWVVGLHIGGLHTGLLFLVPAFVLLLPLLAGRYPGERLLCALIPQARRAPRLLTHGGRAEAAAIRGALLLACALGKRGPPDGAPAA
jgi:hypothetical protein